MAQNDILGRDFLNYAQCMPGGFFIYRADGGEEILFANDNLVELFECGSFEELMAYTGGSFKGLVHPDDLERVERQISDQVGESGDSYDYVQYRIRTKGGRIRYIEDFGCLVRGSGSHGFLPDGQSLFFVFAVDLRDKHYSMDTDCLTGLLSRQRFQLNAGSRLAEGALCKLIGLHGELPRSPMKNS